jgi:hypothetical protein
MTQRDPDAESNSLIPVEAAAAEFDRDSDAMKKGQRLKLIGIAVAGVAVLAVGIFALGHLENRQAFVDAGTHVARLHDTQYERFWNCALVNMNQSQIKSADDLEFQLDKRAAHFGKPYATTLDKCAEDLASMERELATLSTPDALHEKSAALEKATADVRHALQGVTGYLRQSGTPYDASAAKPYLTKLAQSWSTYAQVHTAFTDELRDHLQ